MEKLSDKNPCNTCTVDRQIGNPYRHQCECDRCLKPGRWKNECVKKLAEYEGLEERGKLLKLPVAVGDKIYLPNEYVGKVIDFEIIEICIFKEEIMFIDDSENEYFINDFGKTVFFTKEAAEAALKEMSE